MHHPRADRSTGWTPTAVGHERHPAVRRVADVLRTPAASQRTILVEDEENVVHALRSGVKVDSIYVAAGSKDVLHRLREEAGTATARWFVVEAAVLRAVFRSSRNSRVFAIAQRPARQWLSDLALRPGDVVVLDGVRITGNIGAIVRTVAAFGAAGVVLLDSGIDAPLDRRLVRASRGTVFSVPVVLAEVVEFARWLDEMGLPLLSLDPHARSLMAAQDSQEGPAALLFGGERHGASEALRRRADGTLRILISPDVESLNVSVAVGIALYDRGRSRAAQCSHHRSCPAGSAA